MTHPADVFPIRREEQEPNSAHETSEGSSTPHESRELETEQGRSLAAPWARPNRYALTTLVPAIMSCRPLLSLVNATMMKPAQNTIPLTM